MPLHNLIALPPLAAIVLTLILSPILLMLYKRHVLRLMRRAEGGPGWSPSGHSIAAGPRPPAPRLCSIETRPGAAAAPSDRSSLRFIDAQKRRVVWAYAVAGASHAMATSTIYWLAYPTTMQLPLGIAPLIAFLVPALFTVLYLAQTRRAFIGLFVALGFLGLALLSDGYAGLVALLFRLHVLVPVSVFLVSMHRYWRGVAPLTLVVTYVAATSCVGSAEVGRALLGVDSPALWPLRLVGLAAGAWLGVRCLHRLNRLYLQHRLGEQELFIDSFWLVQTIAQAVILVVVRETWWMLSALLAFPVYLAVKRAALRAARASAPRRPSKLLLLRVFKKDRYFERLFDTLSDRWAFVGRVEMIGGADLALRNISPSDFIEFVSGTLRRRFIRDPEELERRLDELASVAATPDGRFRSEHLFCHDHTWQPVMHAMAARADAVLMDLQAFGASRQGAIHELMHLAVNEPTKPALLIYGQNAELDQVKRLFTDTRARPGADWFTAKADSDRPIEAEPLLRALLTVTTASSSRATGVTENNAAECAL